MRVFDIYQAELTRRAYTADDSQLAAIEVLQRCADDWAGYEAQHSWWQKLWKPQAQLPRGVYLYGGVGRGKSFLMDCFFAAVPVARKTRLHFHEFMREVHRELAALQGTINPLDALGEKMSQRYRLICFDEFHVSDITDAMILDRLLRGLQKYGVGMVTTSNFKPDELYPNGLHRDRFLPAIALIQQTFEAVNVDAGVDYRRMTTLAFALYHTPLNAASDQALQTIFEELTHPSAASHLSDQEESPQLLIASRPLQARRVAKGVVWFDFETLCASARGQNDYLAIAEQFHTVLLSGVPQMFAQHAFQARRLTLLIDVLYDRHVKLVISAAVAPEDLYVEGVFKHEFQRTVSRLCEMQSTEYWALAKRQVDTSLSGA